MKAPTLLGRRLMDRIDGFKLYLEVAEKDELNFANPPEKTPELFERYLPYAIALDVEHEWADKFASVMQNAAQSNHYSPSWYRGSSWHNNNYANFASSMGTGMSSAISSSSTAPGSSSGGGGGGFSGGGGGGGW